MITLKAIKIKFMNFFWEHAQINDVVYKDDFDFNAETKLLYPAAHMEHLTSLIDGKLMYHVYNVVLVDRIDDNIEDMEDEIYSDMLDVAEDFCTWLQYQNEWSYDKRTPFKKIVNDGKDRFCGWEFQVRIALLRPQNECWKPKEIIIPE